MPSFVRHFYTYRCCALALTVSCAAATNLAKKEALPEYFPALLWLDGQSVSPILAFDNKFIIWWLFSLPRLMAVFTTYLI